MLSRLVSKMRSKSVDMVFSMFIYMWIEEVHNGLYVEGDSSPWFQGLGRLISLRRRISRIKWVAERMEREAKRNKRYQKMTSLLGISHLLVHLLFRPVQGHVVGYGRHNPERYDPMKIILIKCHCYGSHEDHKMKQHMWYLPLNGISSQCS